MNNSNEQIDRSAEENIERWTLFQPDQTGGSTGQYDGTASLDPFAYDALTGYVYDTGLPPEGQYGVEGQSDQRSLPTAYPSNYPDQREYDFDTFQSGSGPAGIDPALLLLDHKSGPIPDHSLPCPDESSCIPRSSELHRFAEPSGSPPSKPQGKSTSGGSGASRSKLSHTKLKPAFPDIEAGKAASVTTKSGTWVIRIVASYLIMDDPMIVQVLNMCSMSYCHKDVGLAIGIWGQAIDA
ncbi:hypothetical protein HD553DRAFT_326317 [Filobasidium floriforme]|uniref:uncharacterized protein n=1 Tax=Filobasidium floriforme TaxID=5210 RepID=UPI001E8DCB0F|nr:uncharacterized protein HD553DRAFT_326317 [Filobasidium floriforme]KAH8080008.1 hypothetical protein HD553DRAFT_326317 [Filobasidium floriforme]